MKYSYQKLQCPKCYRKILVECFLIGTNHSMGTKVICAECLPIEPTESFEKQNPEASKDILAWARG